MTLVSNEKKNLNRLAGEFLVASRLTQRGYMITLQWGNTISYDILAFDKRGHVAFIEVKSTASYPSRWILQSKYANPDLDTIPIEKRFICCVDISSHSQEPSIYVFPATVVAKGLHYYFNSKFPNSASYHLSLNFKPQGKTKQRVPTVGEYIEAEKYRENYGILDLNSVAGWNDQTFTQTVRAVFSGTHLPQSTESGQKTCRDEILECAQAVMRQSGSDHFTIPEIISCMAERGSRYAQATIKTHISSLMCANSPKNHAVTYRDIVRANRGEYRLLR